MTLVGIVSVRASQGIIVEMLPFNSILFLRSLDWIILVALTLIASTVRVVSSEMQGSRLPDQLIINRSFGGLQ